MGTVATETAWVGLGQFLSATGSVIGVKLLTEVMAPDTYGVFSLAVITSALLHAVFWGSLASTAQRYYAPYHEQGRVLPFLSALQRQANLSTLLVGLPAAAIICLLAIGGHGEFIALSLLTLLFTAFYGYAHIIDGVQNAARNRVVVSLHSGGLTWLRFGFAYWVVATYGDRSWLAMSGFALAAVLTLGSEWFFFRRKILNVALSEESVDNAGTNEDILTTLRQYALPFSAMAVLICVQQASDRWALQMFHSSNEVGLYSALFQIGYSPIAMLSVFLFQIFNPFIFKRAGIGNDRERIKSADRLNYKVAGIFSIVILLIFFMLFFFSEKLNFLLGEQYHSVIYLLPWMVLAGGIYAITQNIYNHFFIRSNVRALIVPTFAYCILGSGIVFISSLYYGIVGVVLARVLVSVLYLLTVLLMIRRMATSSH